MKRDNEVIKTKTADAVEKNKEIVTKVIDEVICAVEASNVASIAQMLGVTQSSITNAITRESGTEITGMQLRIIQALNISVDKILYGDSNNLTGTNKIKPDPPNSNVWDGLGCGKCGKFLLESFGFCPHCGIGILKDTVRQKYNTDTTYRKQQKARVLQAMDMATTNIQEPSEAVDISIERIERILRGKEELTVLEANKIAKCLNALIGYLLGFGGDEKTSYTSFTNPRVPYRMDRFR